MLVHSIKLVHLQQIAVFGRLSQSIPALSLHDFVAVHTCLSQSISAFSIQVCLSSLFNKIRSIYHRSQCLDVCLSPYLFVLVYTCLSQSISVCLSLYLFVSVHTCQSQSIPDILSRYLFVLVNTCLLNPRLPVHLSPCHSLCQSHLPVFAYLPVCWTYFIICDTVQEAYVRNILVSG